MTLIAVCGLLVRSVFAASVPNIIVIFTDDQGWADLGCQGVRADVRTPHLDDLSARSVRCTAGYMTAPQCSPSRAGLLTGRYQQRFGLEEIPDTPLPLEELTIAERLTSAGYISGMVGKWHLDPNRTSHAWMERNPRSLSRAGRYEVTISEEARQQYSSGGQGFDEFYQNGPGRHWANFQTDGRSLRASGEWTEETTGDRLDDETAGALAFIERNHFRPFFLYLAYSGPHTPLTATRDRLARFPGDMPERRRTALAMLATIDDGVGQIVALLRERNIEHKTLIVFTSDNGAPLKLTLPDTPLDTDAGGWDGSLNEPQLGEKGMLTEGGIRVPFLWCWPGVLPAGKVYEHPISSLDIAATAIAMAGLPHDDALDGVNILPYLRGETDLPPHNALYWRFWNQAAIRAGRWKLIHLGDGTDFLFDLSLPASETKNLAAMHPHKVKELRSRLANWANELSPPGLPREGIGREQRWYEHYLGHTPAAQD